MEMELEAKEKERQEIVRQRRKDDLGDALASGFRRSDLSVRPDLSINQSDLSFRPDLSINQSDLMMSSSPKPKLTECPDPPQHLLTIVETGPYQEWRLNSLNLVKSHTYEDKLDGNCVFHSMSDQLNNVLGIKAPKEALDFRLETVVSLVANRHLLAYETMTIDQWISKYAMDKVHVSHLALQLIANKYKVKIYIYSLFELDGIVEVMPLSQNGVIQHIADCHVLHLSEQRCTSGHYISLRHKAGNFIKLLIAKISLQFI